MSSSNRVRTHRVSLTATRYVASEERKKAVARIQRAAKKCIQDAEKGLLRAKASGKKKDIDASFAALENAIQKSRRLNSRAATLQELSGVGPEGLARELRAAGRAVWPEGEFEVDDETCSVLVIQEKEDVESTIYRRRDLGGVRLNGLPEWPKHRFSTLVEETSRKFFIFRIGGRGESQLFVLEWDEELRSTAAGIGRNAQLRLIEPQEARAMIEASKAMKAFYNQQQDALDAAEAALMRRIDRRDELLCERRHQEEVLREEQDAPQEVISGLLKALEESIRELEALREEQQLWEERMHYSMLVASGRIATRSEVERNDDGASQQEVSGFQLSNEIVDLRHIVDGDDVFELSDEVSDADLTTASNEEEV